MRIFLACPFTKYLRFEGGVARLEPSLAAFLKGIVRALEDAGHDVFLAHRVEEYGAKVRPAGVCTPFDMLEMQRTDVVVAIPEDSYGVHLELGWAAAMDKPTIVVTREGAPETTPLVTGLGTVARCRFLTVPSDVRTNPDAQAWLHAALLERLSERTPREGGRASCAFLSTSFGFGPISKAAVVAAELKRTRPDVRAHCFGAGLDYDFASRSRAFDRVFKIDVDDTEGLTNLVEHLQEYDAVLSVLNLDVLPLWKDRRTPLYFVDSLAWMWPGPPAGIENVSRYFVQDYLTSPDRVRSWGRRLPVELVPPIVGTQARRPASPPGSSDRLFVNLSGCENPYVSPDLYEGYASLLLECILEAAPRREVDVCCNRRLAAVLGRRFEPPSGVRIGHLPHPEFVRRLAGADRVLTSPGITTTLEAISLRKAPRFLLPQNYSQALISERYRAMLGPDLCMAFSTFEGDFEVPGGLPEARGVELVTSLLRTVLRDHRDEVFGRVRRMVASGGADDDVLDTLRGSISRPYDRPGQEAIVARLSEDFGPISSRASRKRPAG